MHAIVNCDKSNIHAIVNCEKSNMHANVKCDKRKKGCTHCYLSAAFFVFRGSALRLALERGSVALWSLLICYWCVICIPMSLTPGNISRFIS